MLVVLVSLSLLLPFSISHTYLDIGLHDPDFIVLWCSIVALVCVNNCKKMYTCTVNLLGVKVDVCPIFTDSLWFDLIPPSVKLKWQIHMRFDFGFLGNLWMTIVNFLYCVIQNFLEHREATRIQILATNGDHLEWLQLLISKFNKLNVTVGSIWRLHITHARRSWCILERVYGDLDFQFRLRDFVPLWRIYKSAGSIN